MPQPQAYVYPLLLPENRRPRERGVPEHIAVEAHAERLPLPRGHGTAQADLLLVDRHGQLVVGLGGVVLANRGYREDLPHEPS
jgi:hypothetical protein